MSRTSLSPSTWPFGAAAEAAPQKFDTVRDVRFAVVTSGAMLALAATAALIGTLLALVLALVGIVVVIVLAMVWTYRTLERPSPAISRDRSLLVVRAFWAAKVAIAAALVVLALLRI